MRLQNGISLLELILLLVLIALLAAALIPRLLRSRIAAAEVAAIAHTITLNRAQAAYVQMYPDTGYARRLAELGTPRGGCGRAPAPSQACLIDSRLAGASRQAADGYYIDVLGDLELARPRRSYTVMAVPQQYGHTGERSFCSLEDRVVRGQDAGPTSLREFRRADCATYPPLP